jgi:hypothetical protein
MGYSTQFIVMDNKLSQKKNMGDRETIVIMHVYMYDLLTSKMEPIVSLVVIIKDPRELDERESRERCSD